MIKVEFPGHPFKVKKEGEKDFCIAEPNETLYDIAQKYGVVLQSLYTYNEITADDYIVGGTKIFLKPVNGESSKLNVQSSTHTTSSTHEVLPKESLYGISKKYGVSVNDLKKWNHLNSDNLQIGQQLIISE